MNGVLIVDDDRDYREFLIRELSKSKSYEVVDGVSCGEEALKVIARRPHDFRFAVIDHLLGQGMDGIETTRELVRICPGLYPVVFSNVRADDRLMEYKFKALEAGAYRYLEKKENGPSQISKFVQEMEYLEHLRNWISDFHEARTAAPSLLTQLDIGMDIIDRHYKVWFMNDAQRRITGFAGPELPKGPCAQWHGFKCCPCDSCLVSDSFKEGASRSGVFLVPFVGRRERDLFYNKVWSQVVTDPTAPPGADGKPVTLAVMESVLELTGTPELKAMPLEERLDIIAKAVWALRERDYSPTRRFEYVRIYVVDRSGAGAFVLKAVAGSRKPGRLGLPVSLRVVDGRRLADAEGHMKSTGYGYWFEHVVGFDPAMPSEQRIPFIYWPIVQDNTTIAVMEVGGRLIKEHTAEILRPYATEVLQAIKDDRDRTPGALATAKATMNVDEVDLALQTQPRSAEEQLQEIVRRACELTGSYQYVVRYREGDDAKLLRLGVSGFCAYEDLASLSYPLSHAKSWSCRTILAGTETLANTAEQQNSIMAFRENLEDRAQQVLKDVNALCYEPLILEGFCIGSMGFHAKTVTNYGENKLAILRLLAMRAAWALHDYLMARAIRERAEADALARILGAVLHNIKTPLASIQINFKLLVEAYDSQGKETNETVELIRTIKGELSKISRLRDTVVKLRKPWETRVEATQLHELIRKIIDARLDSDKNIQVDYSLATSLQHVQIDTAAVEVCLEILVDNAADAIIENPVKRLQIVLRDAAPTETGSEGSPGKLAIDVVDNGPGVPPQIAERLFITMQSGKFHGAGIGLLHCRAIARSAQGDVMHDSKHSPGAKFTLFLPYAKKEI